MTNSTPHETRGRPRKPPASVISEINKDVGIHGLRHSFASHLLENGTDISYIQQLLGHNDVKTTMIYAKVAKKSLRKIKSPLNDL